MSDNPADSLRRELRTQLTAAVESAFGVGHKVTYAVDAILPLVEAARAHALPRSWSPRRDLVCSSAAAQQGDPTACSGCCPNRSPRKAEAVNDDLPTPTSDVSFIGPMARRVITVTGREVPYLSGQELDGGLVNLCVDERFSIDVPVELTDRLVPFIANAIAVAMGYSHHPECDEEPHLRPVHRRWVEVASFETDDGRPKP